MDGSVCAQNVLNGFLLLYTGRLSVCMEHIFRAGVRGVRVESLGRARRGVLKDEAQTILIWAIALIVVLVIFLY